MSYFIPQYLLPTDPVAGQNVEESDEATAGRRRRRKRSKHSSKKHKKRKHKRKSKRAKKTKSVMYVHPPPAAPVVTQVAPGASQYLVNPLAVTQVRAAESFQREEDGGPDGTKKKPVDTTDSAKLAKLMKGFEERNAKLNAKFKAEKAAKAEVKAETQKATKQAAAKARRRAEQAAKEAAALRTPPRGAANNPAPVDTPKAPSATMIEDLCNTIGKPFKVCR